MALRPNNRRGRTHSEKPKGHPIRMGQLLGPYSVGSIYPCDANNVVMIAGLDNYDPDKMEQIDDSRLCKHIGVRKLCAPPKYEKNTASNGFIDAVRFPGWMYCPKCGRMYYINTTNTSSGPVCNNSACYEQYKRRIKLVPERFIVVCPEGHVDDFPVMKWVHRGSDISNTDPHHKITRRTRGGSATMGDIVYKCSCGAERSLNRATTADGLNGIGYHCSGREPWLDRLSPSQPCPSPNENLRVVIMGATNVCYSDTVSSVLIPDPWGKEVQSVAFKYLEKMKVQEAHGTLDDFVEAIASANNIEEDQLRQAYYKAKESAPSSDTSEDAFKHDEYVTLKHPQIVRRGEFTGKQVPPSDYGSETIEDYISAVTLVDTLTVTRALIGFTRLNPEANEMKSMWERRAALSRHKIDWTFAVQTIGEGIFIELSGLKLDEWLERPAVRTRMQLMQANHAAARKAMNLPVKQINPKFIAIHTLAHLLILGISEVCGYSSASLRERIYCERYLDEGQERFEDMHGLLIYTASESGDGSLGGLVRSGEPGRFEKIFHNTLEKALWCSGDPVCIESKGQGLDSCNLAACYNCALVPETSCETGNRLLDRGLLVGTIDEPAAGLIGPELRL